MSFDKFVWNPRSEDVVFFSRAIYFNYLCILPALQDQANKLKEQLESERQEYREIEMNIESMAIKVLEPPAVGSSKIVCSHCHHRGHRNQTSKPCQLKKCCDYTIAD